MEHNIIIIYLLLILANCFAKEMTFSDGDASSRMPFDSFVELVSNDDVIPDGLVSSSLTSNDSEVKLAAVDTLLYLYQAVFTPFISEDNGGVGNGLFANDNNCPSDKVYNPSLKKCNDVGVTAPPTKDEGK